ncbi:hypothetical protein SAMN04488245_105106 [Alloyangia pacifica]|uniref:Uncharacterized protein n=1 Tax=Alloyangia pacifica TaxID=311180 RepID=A0A1I6SWJ7_9RHOB|nr:hypothetical protein SAMN04488245_105106 [Alloyangia pacifica]SFS81289.1 hypothetical protein SAMN04488050_105106 [Alloyangia pacifica]
MGMAVRTWPRWRRNSPAADGVKTDLFAYLAAGGDAWRYVGSLTRPAPSAAARALRSPNATLAIRWTRHWASRWKASVFRACVSSPHIGGYDEPEPLLSEISSDVRWALTPDIIFSVGKGELTRDPRVEKSPGAASAKIILSSVRSDTVRRCLRASISSSLSRDSCARFILLSCTSAVEARRRNLWGSPDYQPLRSLPVRWNPAGFRASRMDRRKGDRSDQPT